MTVTTAPVLVGIVYHSGLAALQKTLNSLQVHQGWDVAILDVSPSQEATDICVRFGIQHLDGSRNGGFAWGVNRIWALVGDAHSVWVACNPDVVFPPHALARLVEEARAREGFIYALQTTSTGVIAPYSVHPVLSLSECLCRAFWFSRKWGRRGADQVIKKAVTSGRTVALPRGVVGSGALIVATAESWQRSGGLDDRFFLFGEDLEFGQRLQRIGIPAYLSPIRVEHEGGFRTRPANPGAIAESLLSQRIYWQKVVGPRTLPLTTVQVAGVVMRLLAAGLLRRDQSQKTWAKVWKLQRHMIKNRLGIARLPLGEDGIRVPLEGGASL